MPGGGFGGGSWGGGAWGGSSGALGPIVASETVTLIEGLVVDLPLKVVGATPLNAFLVEVEFSHDLDPGFGAHTSPANYGITPTLTIFSAVIGPAPNVIRLATSEQAPVFYTLTVAQARSTATDLLSPSFNTANFAGFPIAPTFFAAAQSNTKVMLTFSTAMAQDVEFTTSSNYQIRDFQGNIVPIASVAAQGPSPVSRLTIELASPLDKGGYYLAEVDPAVKTTTGLSLSPNIDVFQWMSMEAPINVGPLVIPIHRFSGEVQGGLLGQPAGQVFFSPALDVPVANSTIQVDEVSLCTRAFDVYEFPQPIDPPPLFTFSAVGPGSSAVLGSTTALWSSAERQGLARVELSDSQAETFTAPTDGPADATLVEPIDITRAGFLNDDRWVLFDGVGTSFITADNLTPIGPGPTTNINLQP